ncbi:hypothetical protein ABW19_dt0202016 [Dactylella cylindrospora]|nr:hypothetical protein ABW19_dt0202016 [Dactylella cylindrospora]
MDHVGSETTLVEIDESWEAWFISELQETVKKAEANGNILLEYQQLEAAGQTGPVNDTALSLPAPDPQAFPPSPGSRTLPLKTPAPQATLSEYFKGRNGKGLSLKGFLQMRNCRVDSYPDERLAFDRISRNSKFYRTLPEKPKDLPRRILFPEAHARRQTKEQACSIPADEVQDTTIVEEPERDPLAIYRHEWKEMHLIALYVLRR